MSRLVLAWPAEQGRQHTLEPLNEKIRLSVALEQGANLLVLDLYLIPQERIFTLQQLNVLGR